MRRVCYSVAMSLDGYIAGPKGEVEWIAVDPEIDFATLFEPFDTVLMGRKISHPAGQVRLVPTGHTIYKKTGIVLLEYDVAIDADEAQGA